jgi:D-3-phosphoglycerate dehydrogenase
MKKVLITDALSPAGKAVLEAANLEIIEILDGDTEKINLAIPEAEGWIIRSGTTIDAEKIVRATKLKVIGRAGVGVDNIDIEAATAHGVVVGNTPGGNTISAAEHTIALMMSLARNIPAGDSSTKAGKWERKALTGTELNKKTLGLIGLGRIGQEVARRALGLQMTVIGYDPYVTQEQLVVKGIEVRPLEDVIAAADVLSLHLPRNKDTLNLIDSVQLKKMKPSAFLINCARGGLVNESDLAAALNAGVIAGAAIDVYSSEPPTDNPLLTANHIVLTPHLGASTTEAGENVAIQVASQVRDYLLEGRLVNTLNLPLADMSILRSIEDTLALAKQIGRLQHPLHHGAIASLELSYNGDAEHITPLLFSAFEGMMEPRMDGKVNIINARAIATEKGITLKTVHDSSLSHVKNVISVNATSAEGVSWNLMGYTDVQGGQRLIRVNQYRVDALLDGPLLLIMNHDVPGVVGEVGTLLGTEKINIAEYSLSRLSGDAALSLIKCDSEPSKVVMEKLKSISAIKDCYFLG